MIALEDCLLPQHRPSSVTHPMFWPTQQRHRWGWSRHGIKCRCGAPPKFPSLWIQYRGHVTRFIHAWHHVWPNIMLDFISYIIGFKECPIGTDWIKILYLPTHRTGLTTQKTEGSRDTNAQPKYTWSHQKHAQKHRARLIQIKHQRENFYKFV